MQPAVSINAPGCTDEDRLNPTRFAAETQLAAQSPAAPGSSMNPSSIPVSPPAAPSPREQPFLAAQINHVHLINPPIQQYDNGDLEGDEEGELPGTPTDQSGTFRKQMLMNKHRYVLNAPLPARPPAHSFSLRSPPLYIGCRVIERRRRTHTNEIICHLRSALHMPLGATKDSVLESAVEFVNDYKAAGGLIENGMPLAGAPLDLSPGSNLLKVSKPRKMRKLLSSMPLMPPAVSLPLSHQTAHGTFRAARVATGHIGLEGHGVVNQTTLAVAVLAAAGGGAMPKHHDEHDQQGQMTTSYQYILRNQGGNHLGGMNQQQISQPHSFANQPPLQNQLQQATPLQGGEYADLGYMTSAQTASAAYQHHQQHQVQLATWPVTGPGMTGAMPPPPAQQHPISSVPPWRTANLSTAGPTMQYEHQLEPRMMPTALPPQCMTNMPPPPSHQGLMQPGQQWCAAGGQQPHNGAAQSASQQNYYMDQPRPPQ